ncbi:hypothetical protein D3C81_2062680 [compost metagenome]
MEVRAAFSAVGEGNDNKIWSSGAALTPNKARVMQAVSRSLAEDVVRQLGDQFSAGGGRVAMGGDSYDGSRGSRGPDAAESPRKVKVFE